jgi:hypothetical protein
MFMLEQALEGYIGLKKSQEIKKKIYYYGTYKIFKSHKVSFKIK